MRSARRTTPRASSAGIRARAARKAGVTARFVQGDAGATGLPDAGVDAVFCNRLLHHIRSALERAAFLRELRRVTRRYLVVSFFDYRSFEALRVFLKKLKGRKVNYAGQPTVEEFAMRSPGAASR